MARSQVNIYGARDGVGNQELGGTVIVQVGNGKTRRSLRERHGILVGKRARAP